MDEAKPLLARLDDGREVLSPKNVEPEDFDEIVAHAAFIHMEMMSAGHLWIGLDAGGRRYMINIWAKGKRLQVRVADDGPVVRPAAPPA